MKSPISEIPQPTERDYSLSQDVQLSSMMKFVMNEIDSEDCLEGSDLPRRPVSITVRYIRLRYVHRHDLQ